MYKTIEDLKNECVKIFGLEHHNTRIFFEECEWGLSFEYMQEELNEMIMYQKINECEVAHAIVKLSTGVVVVVELVNQSFNFYANAWRAIRDIIKEKYMAVEYITVLDIITD
jgi:hypothetical protein